MSRQPTSVSFLISLAFHGIVAVILLLYVLVQKEIIPNPFQVDILAPPPPPKPSVRRPDIKPVPKPIVLQEVSVSAPQTTNRVHATVTSTVKTSDLQAQSVLAFADKAVRVETPRVGDRPRVIDPNVAVPPVVTAANLPIADTPDALAFSSPLGTGGQGGSGRGVGGTGIGRGIAPGRAVALVSQSAQDVKLAGLSLVERLSTVIDGIGDMPFTITLGAPDVLPLPKGEPGGRVVGKGKDIRGVFRLVRARHHLSDWWTDASALSGLAKWLNANTKIHTDMSVEGGAVELRDTNLLRSPVVWMTGHDPTVVTTRGLWGEWGAQMRQGVGRMDKRLEDAEATNLRRYLVDRQGLLVFDDCGLGFGHRQALLEVVRAELQRIVPEYPIVPIPNDHEIYNNFYELGGPPVGFDVQWIAWWGQGHSLKRRNYIEGIMFDGRIGVILSNRDYMCAMQTVGHPSMGYLPRGVPSAYRWATNVVVYGLTHGNIAQYSDYVPENRLADEPMPFKAPLSTRIPSTPIPLEE